eukprot:CAMPEP_0176373180 /NCGR_PEP_ID=MMETSP0126-20121128/25871_1 /TAXON_ID=141414 ORGANISM="Strombidinopsis acuminatum, Strain SPMC142" /NCGR_SAMPLE_ID=MMETSP0126 /ASSEMBLY_ACC=CAM_ASM_000229 /LENGTH=86 /DNA_ID=CAMNT_0017733241 /DNA_START=24 /DNA_END=284 /DNA_ORIENTATION=-
MSLTEAEFTDKLKNFFDSCDADKAGALNQDQAMELGKKMSEGFGQEFDEAKFKERFDSNKNADGKVTWEQFSTKALAGAKERGIVA